MLSNYRSALITGGSSGIGFKLALRLAELELKLVLVSENQEQLIHAKKSILKQFPRCHVKVMCHDLSDHEAVEDLCVKVKQLDTDIDILVNNAGFATWGNLLDTDHNKERSMMSLMIDGTYTLSRYFISQMVSKDLGCIVNVSSIAAFQPNPTLATYGACKSWIYNWTRSISEELSELGSNVQCIAVCPTPVRTNFQKSASMDDSKLFDSPFTVDPDDVAEGIIKAIKSKRSRVVPVIWLEMAQKVTQRLPESWRIWIGKKMLERKDV
ncbi:MAG: SDR family NAD(P)-dependent oxidoreductase [Saprospiraceae bacterium]|nr:SDR family NAD(P)-dependent oxidoreductase [Saprospiraceae bacterium]